MRSNLCLYKSMVLAVLSLPSSQIPTLIGISLCGVFSIFQLFFLDKLKKMVDF